MEKDVKIVLVRRLENIVTDFYECLADYEYQDFERYAKDRHREYQHRLRELGNIAECFGYKDDTCLNILMYDARNEMNEIYNYHINLFK